MFLSYNHAAGHRPIARLISVLVETQGSLFSHFLKHLHSTKFDAASFILAGEIRNRTK